MDEIELTTTVPGRWVHFEATVFLKDGKDFRDDPDAFFNRLASAFERVGFVAFKKLSLTEHDPLVIDGSGGDDGGS